MKCSPGWLGIYELCTLFIDFHLRTRSWSRAPAQCWCGRRSTTGTSPSLYYKKARIDRRSAAYQGRDLRYRALELAITLTYCLTPALRRNGASEAVISTFRGARDDRNVHFILAQADEQHEGLRSTGERAGRARTTGVVVIITVTGPDARSVICGRLVDPDHDAHRADVNVN